MATTYTSAYAKGPESTTTSGKVNGYPNKFPAIAGVMCVAYGEYTLTAAAELGTINNVIEMVRVPANARILGLRCYVPDNDGGTSFTLDIGDGSDTDRFIAASTTGQSAGWIITSSIASTGVGYKYTSADTIDLLVHAAPASAAATSGTVVLAVEYIVEP